MKGYDPASIEERWQRYWEEKGVFRTIVLMWRLRLAYALGADPHDLARTYYGSPGSC